MDIQMMGTFIASLSLSFIVAFMFLFLKDKDPRKLLFIIVFFFGLMSQIPYIIPNWNELQILPNLEIWVGLTPVSGIIITLISVILGKKDFKKPFSLFLIIAALSILVILIPIQINPAMYLIYASLSMSMIGLSALLVIKKRAIPSLMFLLSATFYVVAQSGLYTQSLNPETVFVSVASAHIFMALIFIIPKRGNEEGIDPIFRYKIEMEKIEKQLEKSKEELEKSEEMMRLFFEFAPDAMYISNVSGTFIDGNKAAERLTGYRREELIGKNFLKLELLSKKQLVKASKLLALNVLGKETGPDVFILKRKDGSDVTLEISTYPVKVENKSLVIGIARDITEKNKWLDKLTESEERYKELCEDSMALILKTDINGNIMFANNIIEDYGFSKTDLLSKNVRNFIPKRLWIKLVDISKTVKKGCESRGELTLNTPKGKIDVQYVSRPWRRDGKVMGGITVILDITEKKEIHKKLQNYAKDLEGQVQKRTKDLNKSHQQLQAYSNNLEKIIEERTKELKTAERLAAIGQAATMVGHDLRNPLQAIQNANYCIKRQLGKLETDNSVLHDTGRMLKIIDDSIEYSNNIVSDLKDFSTDRKPERIMNDINELLEYSLNSCKIPKNVEIAKEISQITQLECDKVMMKRVFTNIISNAIQAMPNGGTIKVSTKKLKGYAEVSFEDSGKGISEENIHKLFSPFFTTKAQGMGLGLAICKKIVDYHGGTIYVENKKSEGAKFTIKLPTPDRR